MDITKVGRLRRMVEKLAVMNDDADLTFEFICSSLFPSIWGNVQKEMRDQYTAGYMQGIKDAQNENK